MVDTSYRVSYSPHPGHRGRAQSLDRSPWRIEAEFRSWSVSKSVMCIMLGLAKVRVRKNPRTEKKVPSHPQVLG